jgi:dTDP-4-amino-4,6-dideoxygalactose transaminase
VGPCSSLAERFNPLHIPFNKPYLTGRELEYIQQAHANGQLSGNGPFTKKCQAWIERNSGSLKALLTHSCTGALEMSAILVDLQSGDEVIMPSYTFVSTANAFVLRGAVPVFLDIRPDTLNIDETQIEDAITPKTKAIVAVHYAGVACEMDVLLAIARKHNLLVIEDAAQGIGSKYKGRPLGSLGHFGALSFHETKNIISGEGGALLVNEKPFLERAEIIWEKGTNRQKFLNGQVDKYTWVDIGSSYLPGELGAAFLYAQMEKIDEITSRRLKMWDLYHQAFEDMERKGKVRRPIVPSGCSHNAHMYYMLLENRLERNRFLEVMNEKYDINAVFHYIPLHNSPAGSRFGRANSPLPVTEDLSGRIVRLPLWLGLEEHQTRVIEIIQQILAN